MMKNSLCVPSSSMDPKIQWDAVQVSSSITKIASLLKSPTSIFRDDQKYCRVRRFLRRRKIIQEFGSQSHYKIHQHIIIWIWIVMSLHQVTYMSIEI